MDEIKQPTPMPPADEAHTARERPAVPAGMRRVSEHLASRGLELWQKRAFLARHRIAINEKGDPEHRIDEHTPMTDDDFSEALESALHGAI
jgi:hypothetical protein